MATLLIIASLGFLGSVVATPIVRRLALRCGVVDHPDEHRKLHEEVTSLGGGVAVLFGFLLALGVALWALDASRLLFREEAVFLAGLVAASVIICLVGLIDVILVAWHVKVAPSGDFQFRK